MDNNGHGRRLPILRIISDAFIIPWQRKAVMTKGLALIIVALTLFDFASSALHAIYKGLWLTFIINIAKAPLITLFAVTCHRLILLGDGSVPRHGLYKWSSRETRFVGWTIATYFWFAIITLLISTPLVLLMRSFSSSPNNVWERLLLYILLLPGLYVFSRLSILLPATSVDEPHGFNWAWELTEHNGWRLLLVVAILPLLLSSRWIPHSLLNSLYLNIILHVFAYSMLVIEIAALSISFNFLRTQSGPLIYNEVRKLLTTAAQNKELVEYGQIVKLIWRNGSNYVEDTAKSILEEISEEAYRLKRPMLNALAIDQITRKPTADFFSLARSLNKLNVGATIQQQDIFWESEREAVFAHDWSNDDFYKDDKLHKI